MKKSLQNKIDGFSGLRRRHARQLKVMALLSVCVALSTFCVLMRPAVALSEAEGVSLEPTPTPTATATPEPGLETIETATAALAEDEESGVSLLSEVPTPTLKPGSKFTYTVNDTVDAFTTQDAYSIYRVQNSPLGTAGSFHLVGFGTVNLKTHCNGNVLANTLNAGSNFGTNNYPNELSYVQNYETVNGGSASSVDHVLVLGSANTMGLADNDTALSVNGTKLDRPYRVIQDADTATAPFIDLNAIKADMAARSADLAAVAPTGITSNLVEGTDANNYSFTLQSPDGAGYINMTAAELNSVGTGHEIRLQGFQKDHDGSMIINVDCTGVSVVSMPKAYVYIDGHQQALQETTDFHNGKVIWNFINAEGCTIHTNLMTGAVIALGATVEIDQNLNGTVIAENINVNAESHRTDFTGTTVPARAAFGADKTVDGQTPTADQKFSFILEQWNGAKWTQVGSSVQNSGSSVAFPDLQYKTPGEYVYRIREDRSANSTGYIMSDAQYILSVHVDQKSQNVLSSTITYYKVTADGLEKVDAGQIDFSPDTFAPLSGREEVVFNNQKIQSTKAVLAGKKVLENGTLTDQQFTFGLYQDDASGGKIKLSGTDALPDAKSDVDGNFSFAELSYDTAGTYTYYIREELPEGADEGNDYTFDGIRYDPTFHRVTVTVDVDPNDSAKLIANVVYYDEAGTTPAKDNLLTIINTRIVRSLNLEKVWVDLNGNATDPYDGAFVVTLNLYRSTAELSEGVNGADTLKPLLDAGNLTPVSLKGNATVYTITLNQQNSWRTAVPVAGSEDLFDAKGSPVRLAATDANGTPYFYYAYETSMPTGYRTYGYTGNGISVVTSDATIAVTNCPVQYVLPETGGHGTLPYLAGGLMMMGAALIFVIRAKRRERGLSS